jgi:hypothetical protein
MINSPSQEAVLAEFKQSLRHPIQAQTMVCNSLRNSLNSSDLFNLNTRFLFCIKADLENDSTSSFKPELFLDYLLLILFSKQFPDNPNNEFAEKLKDWNELVSKPSSQLEDFLLKNLLAEISIALNKLS